MTNVSKERPQGFTQLNYQFLTTLSMTGEEFRPRDLPDGWEHSPKEDARQWLTKATETEYYKLRADAAYRRQVFTRQAGWWAPTAKAGPTFWENCWRRTRLSSEESVVPGAAGGHGPCGS